MAPDEQAHQHRARVLACHSIRLVVFHTSDLHNRLTPASAGRLSRLKSSIPNSLMLDSGDALRAGNLFWLPNEPVIGLMNSVRYDAMCMGNREYHFLQSGLMAKTSGAEFPILSANLRSAKAGTETGHYAINEAGTETGRRGVAPYVVIERSGIRVGIIGLTVPCITERMMVKRLAHYYFENPEKAAAETVPGLRAQCDVLIALTHLTDADDRKIASAVPGIDIIMAGHSHTTTEPERVGKTVIVRHGAWARHVGKLTIDVEQSGVKVSDELIPLTEA